MEALCWGADLSTCYLLLGAWCFRVVLVLSFVVLVGGLRILTLGLSTLECGVWTSTVRPEELEDTRRTSRLSRGT